MSTLKADTVTPVTGNTDLTLIGSGTGDVIIDGLTYPTADGSANQIIETNGSGGLSFVAKPTGGAWTLIGTQVASASASLTQTGLDSTYDSYAIAFSDMLPATDSVQSYIRVGDSSGIDSGGSDYDHQSQHFLNTQVQVGVQDTSQIIMQPPAPGSDPIGNDSIGGMSGMFYIHQPGDSAGYVKIQGQMSYMSNAATQRPHGTIFFGCRRSAITLDRVQILFSSGNIASGRMTVWGISHA